MLKLPRNVYREIEITYHYIIDRIFLQPTGIKIIFVFLLIIIIIN